MTCTNHRSGFDTRRHGVDVLTISPPIVAAVRCTIPRPPLPLLNMRAHTPAPYLVRIYSCNSHITSLDSERGIHPQSSATPTLGISMHYEFATSLSRPIKFTRTRFQSWSVYMHQWQNFTTNPPRFHSHTSSQSRLPIAVDIHIEHRFLLTVESWLRAHLTLNGHTSTTDIMNYARTSTTSTALDVLVSRRS